MPLDEAGVPSPVVTMLDAPTRVLVEAGYDRTISPGSPTQASILYFPNPVKTGVNFIIAIPTGMDDGAQEAANIRPFGTPPIDQRSPYGVGGPPVNAGSFDTTGAPLATTPQPAASVPNTQPLAAPQQGPGLPAQPAARPGPLQALLRQRAGCAETIGHRTVTRDGQNGSSDAGRRNDTGMVEAGPTGEPGSRDRRSPHRSTCRSPHRSTCRSRA